MAVLLSDAINKEIKMTQTCLVHDNDEGNTVTAQSTVDIFRIIRRRPTKMPVETCA